MTVKPKIEFDIAWGIEILRMSPAIIEGKEEDVTIDIEGVGFCIEEASWWFLSDYIPKFTLHDSDDPSFPEQDIKLRKEDIGEDCRKVTINIDGTWLKDFADAGRTKIRIDVSHLEDKASSGGIAALNKKAAVPAFITVGNGVDIGAVNPNPAYNGQQIEISAIGMDPVTDNNRFYISSKNGGFIEVQLLSPPKDNIAIIKIPEDAVTGTLILEVNSTRSEPFNIEILPSFLQLQYGDNGNFDDDQFSIIYDEQEVDKTAVGQLNRVFKLNLGLGSHDITIKGLYAPDKLATFYSCFSDNVEIISGATEGRITTTETQNASGIFVNRIRINIKSGDGTSINNCSVSKSNKVQISTKHATTGD